MNEMIKVQSSNINKIGYGNGNLFVEFASGTTYMYEKVPQQLFENMMKAESKGKFLAFEIKPKFKATKVLTENKKGGK